MDAFEYLRLIRGKGLTQSQVSERTGIPQPTISKIERGGVDDVLSKTYLALKALHDELYAPQREPTRDRRKTARA